MQLLTATNDLCVRCGVRVRALHLLQVIDVFDLRVCAETVVVAAEVRLPVREENGLVLGAADPGNR